MRDLVKANKSADQLQSRYPIDQLHMNQSEDEAPQGLGFKLNEMAERARSSSNFSGPQPSLGFRPKSVGHPRGRPKDGQLKTTHIEDERVERVEFDMEIMAGRVGFEPTKELPPCWFSRPVHSTALPPAQMV